MGSYNSDQKNARFYGLKLSRNTDADLIAWLDGKDSIQGYLKHLIREDMKKGEQTMYHIKEEYLSNWGSETDENTVITRDEVERLAEDWNTPIEELLKQLEEI